jgi:hypothetical protein
MRPNDHPAGTFTIMLSKRCKRASSKRILAPIGSLRVIHRGFDNLSPKHRSVYNREILPALNEIARRQYIRERWFEVSSGRTEGTKGSITAPKGSAGHDA